MNLEKVGRKIEHHRFKTVQEIINKIYKITDVTVNKVEYKWYDDIGKDNEIILRTKDEDIFILYIRDNANKIYVTELW
jgi:hypothetical protein